ncbi:hypothetical protein [Streptomyces sp. NPDC053542]|uniref:endo-beta-N-acetylglucosaminidase n=1 Tax=Streptomyces sp. NPDC053542 TaxID=3365710 RepID=UPI0037D4CDC7
MSSGPLDRRTFVRMLGAAGVAVGLAGPLGPFSAQPAAAAAAARGPHQPFMHGYDAAALKSWSPETDRWARYFRSRVPLAARIPAFAATQADPHLATGPKLMNLSYDYDNSFFTAYKYGDVFARRLLRFWQYTDLYGSWHGMPVDGSPEDEPVHGVVNLPNPAWTDAAHRNGARSLGCWFWPRTGEFGDYLERRADGSYPVADGMLAMAEYFGFDGYFLNQEAEISPADARELMRMLEYLRARAPEGFHLQWYDTIMTDGKLDYQNAFNDKNADWVQHGDTPVNHSLFANYWLTEEGVATSRRTAAERGLDPYEVVFHGTETEKYGFNPPFDARIVCPDGEPARTSWALFGSHFPWDRYPDREDPDAQGEVFVRERHYWSGPNEDPTRTGRTEYVPWPDEDDGKPRDEHNFRKWDGVARYITERSVIGGFPFVTRFNTGHGRAFFLAGRQVSDREWNNISIQDVLPTWQFWTRGAGGAEPLRAEYDYGLAYDGGCSLRFSGRLAPEEPTTVRLFKTRLRVTGGERARLVYATDERAGRVELGLITEEDPGTTVWLPAGRPRAGGWTTAELPLTALAGRTVAAVAVRLSTTGGPADHTFRLGELAFLNGRPAPRPAAPAGFTVDAVHPAGDTAEVFLSWQLARQGVWYYDLTRELPDGRTESLGRIFDSVYYVKALARAGSERGTELRLTAVAPDGTRGGTAVATVRWQG